MCLPYIPPVIVRACSSTCCTFAEWKMASLFKLKGDAMPNGKKCSSCDIKFANPSFCADQIWRGCSQCLNTGPLLTVSRVSWNMHAWLRGMICLVFANRIYKRNTVVVDFPHNNTIIICGLSCVGVDNCTCIHAYMYVQRLIQKFCKVVTTYSFIFVISAPYITVFCMTLCCM